MELKKFARDRMDRFMRDEGWSNEKPAPKRIDPQELAMGIKVEREHTKDPRVARKISLDHLSEFAHYYTGLARMERELKAKGDEARKES